MLKRIIVKGRWGAGAFRCDKPHAIISITDNEHEIAELHLSEECLGFVRLGFYDLESDLGPWKAMSLEQGRKIKALIDSLCSDVETLMIHCEAGASRSPSVAMAIADQLKLGRNCIEWIADPHCDPPNRRVYDITRAAWALR